mmetsp:Transcript_16585/g.35886  ORF Transcript_16585/g.35886 Transcript_16585/m.35886 type:complete len:281 (+) Transcript_16585:420-1262(+)
MSTVTWLSDHLDDKLAQVLLFEQGGQPLNHLLLVHNRQVPLLAFGARLGHQLRGSEAEGLHNALQDRVQAACTDVLKGPVQVLRYAGNLVDGGVCEVQVQALCCQQHLLLFDEVEVWLGEDAVKVGAVQRLELHPDGQAALQLRHQVRGLGAVEGSGADEEDVVGVEVAVLGLHCAALNDGQQVALHAHTAWVSPPPRRVAPRHNLVNLVDEDDAIVLGQPHRLLDNDLSGEHALRLGLLQQAAGLSHRHLALVLALDPPRHQLLYIDDHRGGLAHGLAP